MPSLFDIMDLPPASRARLLANNPELASEIQAPASQELANEMTALEAKMIEARDEALALLHKVSATPPPLPVPPKPDNSGSLVFRYAAATAAFIYIIIKAGGIG